MSSLSSIGTTASGGLSISGLASGLDSDKIIQGLLQIQQQKIQTLTNRQTSITQEQTAFKGVQQRLRCRAWSVPWRSQNNAFDARTVASSDESLATAAATSSAVPGVYSFRVNSLARANQIASQGFDDPASLISQGTLQIGLGAATKTITIDSTNNTLAGLAAAINNAGAGVSATVVKDGRNQPYRLVLAATKTGAANSITVVNNLTADAGNAPRPELSGTYVGSVALDAGFTGTSAVAANSGAAGYTGTTNNRYTFTVTQGGSVGSDDGLTLSYSDATGAHTGTVTVNAADVDQKLDVAEGLTVQFGAGTLVAGQKFTLDTFVSTIQQAQDASVSLGSGPGALTITSDDNQVEGVINGVTLNLNGADPTKDVTLTVAADTDKAKTAVHDFVAAFNAVSSFIDTTVSYDGTAKKAGVLLGNSSVTSIQEQIRGTVLRAVANLSPVVNRLGAVGITIDDKGQLQVDDQKLDDALNGRLPGATADDVRRLFALTAKSTNPGIQFVTGSTKTGASDTPYQVDITQAATQGTITATSTLAASTVIDGTNNAFTLTVDGKVSGTITLAQGTYSRQALAKAVQAAINADTTLAGRQVGVNVQGDKLAITSSTYGRSSEVTIGTGTALAALGLAGTETAKGTDVVGNFIVDGQVETAVGSGQFLAGQPGNAHTADLQVRVTLTADQVQSGPEGDVTVTRGVASLLDLTLNSLLDPVSGRLKTVDTGYQDRIDDLQKTIDKQNQFFSDKQAQLQAQFAALEGTISQLKSTGDMLTSQLTNLKYNTSSK